MNDWQYARDVEKHGIWIAKSVGISSNLQKDISFNPQQITPSQKKALTQIGFKEYDVANGDGRSKAENGMERLLFVLKRSSMKKVLKEAKGNGWD